MNSHMKRYIGWGPEHRSFCPCGVWGTLSSQYVNEFWFTNLKALQSPSFRKFYGGFVTQAWLIKSLAIGDWIQIPPSLSSPEVVWGWKFQPFNSHGWLPWQPASILRLSRIFPKVTNITNINSDVVEKELLWITKQPFPVLWLWKDSKNWGEEIKYYNESCSHCYYWLSLEIISFWEIWANVEEDQNIHLL